MKALKLFLFSLFASAAMIAGQSHAQVLSTQTITFDSVADVEALTNFDAFSESNTIFINDSELGGAFKYRADISALKTADTAACVYIADPAGGDDGFVREAYEILNEIDIDWCGAAGDGDDITPTDDAAIIEDWLLASKELQACAFATEKTYLVGVGSALDIVFDGDLCIELTAGATFKGITDTGAEILRLDGATRDHKLSIRGNGGAGFDMTEFEWDGIGTNQGSGLSVQRWGEVLIDNLRFDAGTDYTDGFGDTCLGLSDNYKTRVTNSVFLGCDDEGIYATGGGGASGTDDGGSTVISGNIFQYNSGAISVRRQGKEYTIADNVALDGHTCIKGVEAASAGVQIKPPPEMQVVDNKCYRMLTRAIELRAITAATLVAGNQIHDVNGEAGVWPCINLLGTTRVHVSDNVCEQRTYAQGTTRGVTIANWTFDSGGANEETFNALRNVITDNDFVNVDVGIYDDTASQTAVKALFNSFYTVNTDYSGEIANSYIDFDGDELRVGGDTITVFRRNVPEQYAQIESSTSGNFIRGLSPDANGKGLRFDARTTSGSDPSGGSIFVDFSINGTEHLKVNQDGTVVVRNVPLSDALPAAGDYRITYNGGRLTSDPAGDTYISVPSATFTSAGLAGMDGWADGVWTLEALRGSSTDFCTEQVSVLSGTYIFGFNSYASQGAFSCDWQANSDDLEFSTTRSGTNLWQIKATLTNPRE